MHSLKIKFTILKLIWFLFNDPADTSPSWLLNHYVSEVCCECVCRVCTSEVPEPRELARDWNMACEVCEHLPRGDSSSNIHWDAFIG